MKFLHTLLVAGLALQSAALSIGGKSFKVKRDSNSLQDIVTWDESSIFIRGERILFFGGEFHPFRLPVPGLYLDVFQKIKAAGFSAVSFYVDWALLEGEPGVYRDEGVFNLEPFLQAAGEAGLYLVARPGPYINAETAGGGLALWLSRLKSSPRTRDPEYLAASALYVASVAKTIAKYQITNGGPVILLQVENEYSGGLDPFPDNVYFAHLEQQYLDAGIVVPFINNDAWQGGHEAPGTVINGSTAGNVDIYGFDNYPNGFDCSHPYTWPNTTLQDYHDDHERISPSTPLIIPEFQGGSIDGWGSAGYDQCAVLLNMEFERVFYKYDISQGVVLLDLYMIFGGTNWGNLGYSGVYTSYDYGSAIKENRQITREKYSEAKLIANFLKVSPDLLTSQVGSPVNSFASNPAITVNPLIGNGSATNFYLIRHTDQTEDIPLSYQVTLPTSKGVVTLPQLGGALTLNGRDAKWHVTDYPIGSASLLYSTAEILTWKTVDKKTVLVVYSGPNEQHELAVLGNALPKTIEGPGVTTKITNGTAILGWKTSPTRRVVTVGNILVYILDRNTAYNYWVPDFKRSDEWQSYTTNIANRASVIVEAGYLIRDINIQGSTLQIRGDLNATVPVKILNPPTSTKQLSFNGQNVQFQTNPVTGEWTSTLQYHAPAVRLPDLSRLEWKYTDDLPEVQASYDDSAWTKADHTTSFNPMNLTTPTSLYADDYGFHTGVLLYRGHFTANGHETTINLTTAGGSGYGASIWLGSTYLGSWVGDAPISLHSDLYTLPNLKAGKQYIITVVVDNLGLDEDWYVGGDDIKSPRGIISYSLTGRQQSAITWKLTGNLGGEHYVDKIHGPLNEGGLYAERQGYHLPSPPTQNWPTLSPLVGTKTAGIAFYSTFFDLNLPSGYDIPLSFNIGNSTTNGGPVHYMAEMYVNGFQFMTYINNLGPQSSFPVPQGILNYQGRNWIAVEIWAREATGAKFASFTLQADGLVVSSMTAPAVVDGGVWSKRNGAY